MTVLLIATAATADLDEARSVLRRPVLVALGEWSFSLYLIQVIIIDETVKLLPDGGSRAMGGMLCLITITLCIAGSWLFHTSVEVPLNDWLKPARDRRKPVLGNDFAQRSVGQSIQQSSFSVDLNVAADHVDSVGYLRRARSLDQNSGAQLERE